MQMCDCVTCKGGFTNQGKFVDLGGKKALICRDTNSESDSAEVSSLVYLPRVNVYLSVLF